MNVLMVLDGVFPFDERVEKEAMSLIEQGYEVHLLCFRYSKKTDENEVYKNIHIHRIYVNRLMIKKLHPILFYTHHYSIILYNKTVFYIKKYNIKILHVHDLPLCSLAHRIKNNIPIRYIADLHENFPELISTMSYMNFYTKFLIRIEKWYAMEQKWLQNTDGVLVTARGMKERISRSASVQDNKITILENTIKTEDYTLSSVVPDPDFFTLLYTGGITADRGLDVVLDAMKLIQKEHSHIRFWIIGSGKHLPALMNRKKELELKNVTFFGWKPAREMFQLMLQSDAGVIPHLKSEHTDNTSPNKIFQYFYAKKPVLASNCNYLVDIIEETRAGLNYEYDNPLDFFQKLKNMIFDENYKGMGQKGYQAVINKYNWKITEKNLINCYSEIYPDYR